MMNGKIFPDPAGLPVLSESNVQIDPSSISFKHFLSTPFKQYVQYFGGNITFCIGDITKIKMVKQRWILFVT
ncbi:hypothetical protein [Xenorhabdus sp. PB62.4]|uniref:hypothetical protein n=1 Tax=Xenorhabdus sp. PB62.4 TaxID=1851573 RepID=UPI001656EEB6|nr:hypothetical protein [Xenorhabdus sp. PB62.4]